MSSTREYILRLEDVDANYELTNKALLALMENVADEDSGKAGDDIMALNTRGLSWVIVEWRLEVFERPKYRDRVRVETWPREVGSRFVWRDFEVYHGKKLIAVASSKWMIVDLTKKAVIRIDNARIMKYQTEKRSAFQKPLTNRLKANIMYDETAPAIIRKSDIDLNGHLHNLAYLDLIKEHISYEPNIMRIIFHREIKYDDKVVIKIAKNSPMSQIAIVDQNDKVYSLVEFSNTI